jgi:hypothetical protein
VIVECPKCEKKYKIDEERYFQGKESISLKCPGCSEIMRIKKDPDSTGPTTPPTQRFRVPDDVIKAKRHDDIPDAHLLRMPEGVRISLAVLSGPDAGAVFYVTEPVTVMGRSGCDVVLNDAEVSRNHARIEVRDNLFTLRDLKSTNGTYINEQHIQASTLENRTEFRVGGTLLMFLTTKDEY